MMEERKGAWVRMCCALGGNADRGRRTVCVELDIREWLLALDALEVLLVEGKPHCLHKLHGNRSVLCTQP